MKTVLNEDVKRYLKENYLEKTNRDMGQELGVSHRTIGDWREKIGLPRSTNLKDYTQYKNYIIQNHSRRTASSLSKEIGCSKSFVIKVWREANLKKSSTHRYFCNEKFFETIDNEKKAYWLGFIAADGCVYIRAGHQGQVSLTIQERDKELLEQFKQDTESTHPINKCGSFVSINLVSQKMFDDLNEKGIIPRKTWHLDFNKIYSYVGKQFFPDFVRGYFDGDGSIHYKDGKDICHSYIFFAIPLISGKQLQTILQHEYNILLNFRQDTRKAHYSQPFGSLYTPNATSKYLLGKFMYPHANKFGLVRKKIRILKMINRITSNDTNRSENVVAVKKGEELLEHLNWQSAAEPMKFDNSNRKVQRLTSEDEQPINLTRVSPANGEDIV